MKARTVIIITALLLLLFMFLFPWLAITFSPDLTGIGLWFFSFMAVNPLVIGVVGIMAGTALKKLWWLPLLSALLFPPLFSIAIGEFVWDLYAYCVFYLPIAVITMFVSYLVARKVGKQK